MNKEEIKDYLKRVDELGAKLTGEDKETYTWLIYGYNQCAKLLNETKQQCEKQKEVIDKVNVFLNNHDKNAGNLYYKYNNKYLLSEIKEDIRKILKEVSE